MSLLDLEIHGLEGVKKALARILAKPKIPLIQNSGGPLGVVMIAGPTGVGKTEIGHALAKILYGSRDRLTHIKCDTLQESHKFSILTGSPPGYYNHGDPTPLADTMLFRGYEEGRKAGCLHKLVQGRSGSAILMFDEIEKAHPVIQQGLLTPMSTGVFPLTSGKEITSDSRIRVEHSCETQLHNTIIIFTSNVGEHSFAILNDKANIGFQGSAPILESDRERHFLRELKRQFSPEFLGRIDYIERARAHTAEDTRAVATLMINKWKRSMYASFGDRIEVVTDTPAMVKSLVSNVNTESGARFLSRQFKLRVEDVFENGIPDYFLDSLEETRYLCKVGVNASNEIQFHLDPLKKKIATPSQNRTKNVELENLPQIIEAINRYQAVAHLSSFDDDLKGELEADLKKYRKQLSELGVGQNVIRRLDGKHVENYIQYLDTFLHAYDGVVHDFEGEFAIEISILKGMIRYALKIEKKRGTPVIDTMLLLLAKSGYPELTHTQMQKIGSLIHQQRLSAFGMV